MEFAVSIVATRPAAVEIRLPVKMTDPVAGRLDIADIKQHAAWQVVELVMALEEVFDIEIPDEEAERMNTIGDVEAYVAKQVAS